MLRTCNRIWVTASPRTGFGCVTPAAYKGGASSGHRHGMMHASSAPIRDCSPELCTVAYIRFTAVNLSLCKTSMTSVA